MAQYEPDGELDSSGQYYFCGELDRRRLVFSRLSVKKPDSILSFESLVQWIECLFGRQIWFLFLNLCGDYLTSHKCLLFFDCFLLCKHRIQLIFLVNVKSPWW